MNIQFKIDGLTCEACEKISAKKIAKISGVSAVSVNKDSGLATISAERVIALEEINQALKDTDFKAALN